MPSSVSIPADMTQSPDPQPDEPTTNPEAAAAGTAAGQARRARAARNISPTGPLIAIIVLLAGAVGGLVLRDLNRLDADIAQLRVDMNAGFADMDARFDELENDVDARFDEINLKLTALIATLNKTDEVDAALEGRLLAPGADPVEPRSAGP